MNKWNRTVDIKAHITDDETMEGIVKAMTGIFGVLKTDPELYEEFREDFETLLENCNDGFFDEQEALSESNYILSELYDYADNRRIWLGI